MLPADQEIAAEYLRRFNAAQATQFGANHDAICADLALENGMDKGEVEEIVLNETIMGPG